jgi:hypothetical protein
MQASEVLMSFGVRPLQWVEVRSTDSIFRGAEVVRVWDGKSIDVSWATVIECTDGMFTLLSKPACGRYETFEKASAQAQEDFIGRITSILVSPEQKPVAHLVWKQGRRAIDDVEDYYEVARPGDKSVDGSDPFPVWNHPHQMSDKAIRELAAQTRYNVPDGWQLMPKEATPEIVGAWWRYKNGHHFQDDPAPTDTSDYGAYRAILAAAPSPSRTVEIPEVSGSIHAQTLRLAAAREQESGNGRAAEELRAAMRYIERKAAEDECRPEPSGIDALQAIADLPTGDTEEVMLGHEEAYRAVESLFEIKPRIVCSDKAAGGGNG